MTAEKQALAPDFVDVLFGGFLGALLASLVPLLGEAWWRRAKRLECMPVLDRVHELRETLEPPNPMAVHQETQEYMPGAAQAVKFGFLDCRVTEAMGHTAFNHLTADGQRAWRIHNRWWKMSYRAAWYRLKRICGVRNPTVLGVYTRLSKYPPEHKLRRTRRKRNRVVDKQHLMRPWGRGLCWCCEKRLWPWNDSLYCKACQSERCQSSSRQLPTSDSSAE